MAQATNATDPKSPFEDLFHLLKRSVNGYMIDEESICHYQDVFGHSSIEQLEEAANGPLRETFWNLYFRAYGAAQAIYFHGQHGVTIQKCKDEIDCLNERLASEEAEKTNLIKKNRELEARIEQLKKDLDIEMFDHVGDRQKLEEAENEIIRLKAKLFDFMEAQK